MTGPDPRSISETLRRTAMVLDSLGSQSDAKEQLRALADRLSFEGPPRVGDLVRVYSMKEDPKNEAIVIALSSDGCLIAYVNAKFALHSVEWRLLEELRVLARSAWSDDLEQTR